MGFWEVLVIKSFLAYKMGISLDSWHKRRKTGGKRPQPHKKRKYQLGRPASMTKIGAKRVHLVRTRGGNTRVRGLRMDTGNFSWGSEAITRKTRVLDVMYNASNNELLRTKTLVKNAIIQIDSTPFRTWYEAHYATPIAKKRTAKKYDERQKLPKLVPALEEQFVQGKLLACISSRPGQCGRCDGYILEGKQLEFYQKKMKARKGK